MRRIILSVLLATSVAVPALAQEREGRRERGTQSASEPHNEARIERRAQRAERREERVSSAQEAGGEERPTRPSFEQRNGGRRTWDERRSNNDGLAAPFARQQADVPAREGEEAVHERRVDGRVGRSRDGSILGRALENSHAGSGQVVDRRDRGEWSRSRHSGGDRRWRDDWRRDRAYDWRNHRNAHRSIFRRGTYRDPYGWGYRRFSIGFSLFPSYYRPNYWLSDPWQYRLPPAYGPFRWVRYYDDALLVNIYTGQVVDVEHNFFW